MPWACARYAGACAASARSRPSSSSAAHRYVRHPLYLFVLILIWSAPQMTADRLLFNILWTAWIVIGARLEERDLVGEFGDAYRDYQRRVPMLLPWPRPRASSV